MFENTQPDFIAQKIYNQILKTPRSYASYLQEETMETNSH